ncbi:GDSL-type esterase/lipase family protein [Marinimicrobium sp. ARAG 43.8]|uniref:GDSL-type esterase/lipase family protein n=1 Tax=Marinimicrobium sp. ARAG 43.8 TaxID=3418719 RepID=UPI003CEF189E
MTQTVRLLGALLLGAVLFGCSEQEANLPNPADRPAAITPSPRTVEYEWMSIERWNTLHAEDVAIAEEGDVDLLFIGDSITEGWPPALMEEYFGDYQWANFGIGGDKTENLLWRLNNGAVGNLDPQAVSLLIGVNNLGLSQHSPDDVALGVQAVVETLLDAFPNARILVHGVFPYRESPDDPARDQVRQINRQIANLASEERVFYLNIGDQLVEEDGHISTDIMPDHLHLSEQGYRIWAGNLQPIFADWLEE